MAAHTVALIEVEPETAQAGLPQLDHTSFSEQIAWLFLTFMVFYVIVSKIALPKIDAIYIERDEKITTDLEKAEKLQKEVQDIKETYEASLAKAKVDAQKASMDTKDSIQTDVAKATADLEAKIAADAETAAVRIASAKTEAMGELKTISVEAALDLVSKLTGEKADKAVVEAAVKAELTGKGL